ncbi:MAG: hypothetical protein E7048_09835, partial [Lentisphaerae bacterium]|nr:hypothetical protein [Lentisphaerota bacterium]
MEKNPTAKTWQIDTIDELKAFRDEVNAGNSFAGWTITLGDDIDISGENWTSIGNVTNSFQGTFDGGGHTISGLTINNATLDYAGFFGFIDAGSVNDVIFENVTINARNYVGTVVGYTNAEYGDCVISNVTVTGTVQITGGAAVGGIAGGGDASLADVTVNATGTLNGIAGTSGDVGGIIGRAENDNKQYNDGEYQYSNLATNINVAGSGAGVNSVGGVIGSADAGIYVDGIACTARSVVADGIAEEGKDCVGGLVGAYGENVTLNGASLVGTAISGSYVQESDGKEITNKNVVDNFFSGEGASVITVNSIGNLDVGFDVVLINTDLTAKNLNVKPGVTFTLEKSQTVFDDLDIHGSVELAAVESSVKGIDMTLGDNAKITIDASGFTKGCKRVFDLSDPDGSFAEENGTRIVVENLAEDVNVFYAFDGDISISDADANNVYLVNDVDDEADFGVGYASRAYVGINVFNVTEKAYCFSNLMEPEFFNIKGSFEIDAAFVNNADRTLSFLKLKDADAAAITFNGAENTIDGVFSVGAGVDFTLTGTADISGEIALDGTLTIAGADLADAVITAGEDGRVVSAGVLNVLNSNVIFNGGTYDVATITLGDKAVLDITADTVITGVINDLNNGTIALYNDASFTAQNEISINRIYVGRDYSAGADSTNSVFTVADGVKVTLTTLNARSGNEVVVNGIISADQVYLYGAETTVAESGTITVGGKGLQLLKEAELLVQGTLDWAETSELTINAGTSVTFDGGDLLATGNAAVVNNGTLNVIGETTLQITDLQGAGVVNFTGATLSADSSFNSDSAEMVYIFDGDNTINADMTLASSYIEGATLSGATFQIGAELDKAATLTLADGVTLELSSYFGIGGEGEGFANHTLNLGNGAAVTLTDFNNLLVVKQSGIVNAAGGSISASEIKIAGIADLTDGASVTANQMNLYGEEGAESAAMNIVNSTVAVRDGLNVGHSTNNERTGTLLLDNATVEGGLTVNASGSVNVAANSTVTNINNNGEFTVASGVQLTADTFANTGIFTVNGGKFDIETLTNDDTLNVSGTVTLDAASLTGTGRVNFNGATVEAASVFNSESAEMVYVFDGANIVRANMILASSYIEGATLSGATLQIGAAADKAASLTLSNNAVLTYGGYLGLGGEGEDAAAETHKLYITAGAKVTSNSEENLFVVKQSGFVSVKGSVEVSEMKIAGTVNMTDAASVNANQMNLYGETGLSARLNVNNSTVSVRDFIQVGHANDANRMGFVSLYNATVDTTVNVSAAGTVNVSKDSTVTNINNDGTVTAAGNLTSENIVNNGELTVAPGVTLTAAAVANNGKFTINGGKFDIETLTNDGTLNVSGTVTLDAASLTGSGRVNFNDVTVEAGSVFNSDSAEMVYVFGGNNILRANMNLASSYIEGATLSGATVQLGSALDEVATLTLSKNTTLTFGEYFGIGGEGEGASSQKHTLYLGENAKVASSSGENLMVIKESGYVRLDSSSIEVSQIKVAGGVRMLNGAVVTADQLNLYGEAGKNAVMNVENSTLNLTDWFNVGYAADADRMGVLTLSNATVNTTLNVSASGSVIVDADSAVNGVINNAGSIFIDQDACLTADALNGSVTFDAAGFTGVKKILDLTSDVSSEGKIQFLNGELSCIYGADGDITVTDGDITICTVSPDFAGEYGTVVGDKLYYGVNAFSSVDDAVKHAADAAYVSKIVVDGQVDAALHYGVVSNNPNGLVIEMGNNGLSLDEHGDYKFAEGAPEVGAEIWAHEDAVFGENVVINADILWANDLNIKNSVLGEINVNAVYSHLGSIDLYGKLNVSDRMVITKEAQDVITINEGAEFTAAFINDYPDAADALFTVNGKAAVGNFVLGGTVTVGETGELAISEGGSIGTFDVQGSVALNTTDTLQVENLTGNGTIAYDAADFSGALKVLDITGNAGFEGTIDFVGKPENVSVLTLKDGDIVLTDAVFEKYYVNAAYADLEYGDAIPGMDKVYFGINAFANFNDAYSAERYEGFEEIVVLSDVTDVLSGKTYSGKIVAGEGLKVTVADSANNNYVNFTDANIGKNITVDAKYFYLYGENTFACDVNCATTFYSSGKLTLTGNAEVYTAMSRYYAKADDGIYVVGTAEAGKGAEAEVQFKAKNYLGHYSGTFSVKDTAAEFGYILLGHDTEVSHIGDKSELAAKLVLDNARVSTIGGPNTQPGQVLMVHSASIAAANGSLLDFTGPKEFGYLSMAEGTSITLTDSEMRLGKEGQGSNNINGAITLNSSKLSALGTINVGETGSITTAASEKGGINVIFANKIVNKGTITVGGLTTLTAKNFAGNTIIIADGATLRDTEVLSDKYLELNITENDAYVDYVLSVNGDKAGTVYFQGKNFISSIDAGVRDTVVVKGETTSLHIGNDGFKLGNGANWIIGAGASVSADYYLSLDSVKDNTAKSTMLVENASLNVKGISAKGTTQPIGSGAFDVTFNKANVTLGNVGIRIQDQSPESADISITFKESKFTADVNDLKNDAANSEVTFEATDVNFTRTFRNNGTLNITNGSKVSAKNLYATGEHLSANSGTINVKNATLNLSEKVAFDNSGTINVEGESTLNIGILTGNAVNVLDGAVIKDSTVGGNLSVEGNVTFRGDNTFNMIYDFGTAYTPNQKWTVEAGASLNLTSSDKYGLGYGDNVSINGELLDAKEAWEAGLAKEDASFNAVGGVIAMTNSGYADTTSYFTVENAYVRIGMDTADKAFNNRVKADGASGTYIYSFSNSVLEVNSFNFQETEGLGNGNYHFTFTDSVLVAGPLNTNDKDSSFTFDNTDVTASSASTNGGDLSFVNGTNAVYRNVLTNNGSLTIDAASTLTAVGIAGEGTITIDAANFEGGVKKIIDLTSTTSLEGSVDVINLGDNNVFYGADGDVYITDQNRDTIYVGSKYAGEFGTAADDNRVIGYNAFDAFAENTDPAASAFWKGVSAVVLSAGNSESEIYGSSRLMPSEGVTEFSISTTGEGYALLDRLSLRSASEPVEVTIEEGSRIKTTLGGYVNPNFTLTVNGEVDVAASGSGVEFRVYPGGILNVAQGGKFVVSGGQFISTGTVNVYGAMEINGKEGDYYAKLAGDDAQHASNFNIDGGSLAINQKAFSIGGGWGWTWLPITNGENCKFTITNNGTFTSTASYFRISAAGILDISNGGSMTFTNEDAASAYGVYCNKNEGTVQLNGGALDVSNLKEFANAGTMQLTGDAKLTVGDDFINETEITLEDFTGSVSGTINGGSVVFEGKSTLASAADFTETLTQVSDDAQLVIAENGTLSANVITNMGTTQTASGALAAELVNNGGVIDAQGGKIDATRIEMQYGTWELGGFTASNADRDIEVSFIKEGDSFLNGITFKVTLKAGETSISGEAFKGIFSDETANKYMTAGNYIVTAADRENEYAVRGEMTIEQGTFKVTGKSELDIAAVNNGFVELRDGGDITDSSVNGTVVVYGTTGKISGETTIKALYVGYPSGYAVEEAVSAAITGDFTSSSNFIVGKYGTVNIGDAAGERTTVQMVNANWINNSTVNITNADVTGTNALSMTGKVTLDNASVLVKSEGQMNYGGSDGKVTLKNGSSLEYTSYFYVGGYYQNQSATLEVSDDSVVNGKIILTSDKAVMSFDDSTLNVTNELNLAGTLNLDNGSTADIKNLVITASGKLNADWDSNIKFGALTNAGAITFDMTGAEGCILKVMDYTGSGAMDLDAYGNVTAGDVYNGFKVYNNDLYAVTADFSEKHVTLSTPWAGSEDYEQVAAGCIYGVNAVGSLTELAAGMVTGVADDVEKLTITGSEGNLGQFTFNHSGVALEIVNNSDITANLTMTGANVTIAEGSTFGGTITANASFKLSGTGIVNGTLCGSNSGNLTIQDETYVNAIEGFTSITANAFNAGDISMTLGSDSFYANGNVTVDGAIDFMTGYEDKLVIADGVSVAAGAIEGSGNLIISMGYAGEAVITVTDNGAFGTNSNLVIDLTGFTADADGESLLVSGITEFAGSVTINGESAALNDSIIINGSEYKLNLTDEGLALVFNLDVDYYTGDFDGNGTADVLCYQAA